MIIKEYNQQLRTASHWSLVFMSLSLSRSLSLALSLSLPPALGLCLRGSRALSQLAELPEMHQMMRQTCRDYAAKELAPIAATLDKNHTYPAKQVH